MVFTMIRTIIMMLFAAMTVVASANAQQTELAEPLPTFDEPRKIMLQLSSGDPQKINDILFNAVNLQKYYGMDNVRIRIVAFGRGMQALYTTDSPVRERIESLLKYDVEFVGCGNTMDATEHSPADLIPGVSWVQAGIAEIVESRMRGWVYISP